MKERKIFIKNLSKNIKKLKLSIKMMQLKSHPLNFNDKRLRFKCQISITMRSSKTFKYRHLWIEKAIFLPIFQKYSLRYLKNHLFLKVMLVKLNQPKKKSQRKRRQFKKLFKITTTTFNLLMKTNRKSRKSKRKKRKKKVKIKASRKNQKNRKILRSSRRKNQKFRSNSNFYEVENREKVIFIKCWEQVIKYAQKLIIVFNFNSKQCELKSSQSSRRLYSLAERTNKPLK